MDAYDVSRNTDGTWLVMKLGHGYATIIGRRATEDDAWVLAGAHQNIRLVRA